MLDDGGLIYIHPTVHTSLKYISHKMCSYFKHLAEVFYQLHYYRYIDWWENIGSKLN